MKHMYIHVLTKASERGRGVAKLVMTMRHVVSGRGQPPPPTFSRIIFETSFFFSHIKKIEVSRSTPLLFWEYMYVKNCNEKKEIK